MAPSRAPAAGCARATTDRPQDVHGDGLRGVRGPRCPRTVATGEHARKRSVQTLTALTPREAQIARFALRTEQRASQRDARPAARLEDLYTSANSVFSSR